MDKKERFIRDWTDRLLDHMLDESKVQESICEGCVWLGMDPRNPDSGCDGFDGLCNHSDRVQYVEDLCRQAAETLAEAI